MSEVEYEVEDGRLPRGGEGGGGGARESRKYDAGTLIFQQIQAAKLISSS